jgi:hypothetical protein
MSPDFAPSITNANIPNHGLCRLECTRHARPRGSVLGAGESGAAGPEQQHDTQTQTRQ